MFCEQFFLVFEVLKSFKVLKYSALDAGLFRAKKLHFLTHMMIYHIYQGVLCCMMFIHWKHDMMYFLQIPNSYHSWKKRAELWYIGMVLQQQQVLSVRNWFMACLHRIAAQPHVWRIVQIFRVQMVYPVRRFATHCCCSSYLSLLTAT